MAKLLIIISILLSFPLAIAQFQEEKMNDEDASVFSGRISRLNRPARLARIRTDFGNIKFLNRKDQITFWNETYPDMRCAAVIEGRTNDYFLIKIPQFEECIRKIHFTTGSYLHFDSEDLKQTMKIARELVEVLLKKRLAMRAMRDRHQKNLDGYVEKIDVVNKRYEILRQKLEIEWQKELSQIEEDKTRTFADFKNAEARMNEIDTKLEAYRLEDHNLKLDRWSLDPALYIRK